MTKQATTNQAMANPAAQGKPVRLAYIGCWYKNDMYSHNCSNLVDSLRNTGMSVDVITSNCRCFSSAQEFSISKGELINENCCPIAIPHAPRNPGKKHGRLKRWTVKILRLDLMTATARGLLYYRRARQADVIHFDQVLEAFGCIPLFIVIYLSGRSGKKVVVTVHEIDPFQLKHKGFNRLYDQCSEVLVYSENMRQQVVALGAAGENIKVIRYGARIPDLLPLERKAYIYFGGHTITRGKGYLELLDALNILKARGLNIPLVIYVGHGCNGLEEARLMAIGKGVSPMIQWEDFYSAEQLTEAYQRSKACIIPFTGGSARHPLSSAMVNATPVIATRAVDIPEYLGDLGIYVDGSALSIADAITEVENGHRDLKRLGEDLRARALAELDYSKIAANLSEEYRRIGETGRLMQIGPAALA